MTTTKIHIPSRVPIVTRICIILSHVFCLTLGSMCGIILLSSVIFTEQEFWQNCAAFWGWL